MSWPTVSKGIFYPGYNKAKSEGKAPATRSMQTVSANGGKKESARSRMLYPAASPLTAESMRKPN